MNGSDHEQRPVCLITGGSSGIGLASARRFAQGGFDLVICGRDGQRLATAATEVVALGVECDFVSIDLDKEADRAGELVNRVWDRFGRLDVLVNNAGMAPLSPFAEIDSATFESTVNVNQRAVFHLTQAAWRKMARSQTPSVIVNVSSLAAVDPFPGFSIYGASKAWLDLLTLALAGEGKEIGISVFSVRPGAVETPLLRSLFPDFPVEQTVTPEQVAEKIWELSQPEQASYSGQAFAVTNQVM